MIPTFAVRLNLFKPEQQVRLEPDAVVLSGPRGDDVRLRYADVSWVRLMSVPTQTGVHRECRLKGRGGKTVRIHALYYTGLGKVDDRTSAYAPFVRDLLGRVASANPAVITQANSRWLWWLYALLLAMLAAVVGLLLIATVMEPQIALKTSAPMMVLVFVGPLMWRYLKNASGTFDPRQPPPELLGA